MMLHATYCFSANVLLAVATMMIASGQDPTSATSNSSDNESNARSPSIVDTVQTAIIDRTNQFRQSKGLNPVQRDEHLMQAASKFAEFMARTDKYGHRANGMTPAQRAEAAGYDYCVVRENIAYRTNTGEVTSDSLIEVFVQGWIDSPPHRENMLADFVTQTGVAVATSDDVTYYAVQMFGRPRSAAFRVKLTNESGETKTLVFHNQDQKDEVEIEPRMILKMTRCLPTKISLAGSDDSKEIRSDATLTITTDGLVDSTDASDHQ